MNLFKMLFVFVISVAAISCGESGQKSEGTESEKAEQAGAPNEITDLAGVTAYYECPMKCDGKKYDGPGTCPVCGMDLVKVDAGSVGTEEHSHDHHGDSAHVH